MGATEQVEICAALTQIKGACGTPRRALLGSAGGSERVFETHVETPRPHSRVAMTVCDFLRASPQSMLGLALQPLLPERRMV